MLYSRRFSAFLPLDTFTASTVIGIVLVPKIKFLPVLVQILICLVLVVSIYYMLYVGNLLLIICLGRSEVNVVLCRRWKERMLAALEETAVDQPIADYVERAAEIHVRLSRPEAVKSTLVSLMESERNALLGLRQENEKLRSGMLLSSIAKNLANRWRSSERIALRESRIIDDPVYGCVALDEKLSTVLAHPLLQRLNRVRQLSFSYAQFPSSTHSRLSHCLGVAKNADLALGGIFDRGQYYVLGENSPREFPEEILRSRKAIIQKAKLAAILHDLGHGPFGHALDNYVGFVDPGKPSQKPDKIYTAQYIQQSFTAVQNRTGL